MNIRFIHSITELSAHQWNTLWPDYPFVRHEFLASLETNACASAITGWQPCHLVVEKTDTLVAAMPLYLKMDSRGEYVFDWVWADAYHREKLHYYPKLLCAIPFTPATGPRLGFLPGLSQSEIATLSLDMISACKEKIASMHASGLHILFPNSDSLTKLHTSALQKRLAFQYHWFNREFTCFDDFLQTFSSRKRKALRRERAKVKAAGLEIELLEGKDIPAELWETFYIFYHTTYFKRSGQGGYLSREFFFDIASSMQNHIVMSVAKSSGRAVAIALFFKDQDNLYGRYWGCAEEVDCLHFELCYYQGIEYAIKHQLKRFDPGAQGEHKIQRGFTPVYTSSYHWLAHADFDRAIGNFLQEEQKYLEDQLPQSRALMPFKDGVELIPEDALLQGES